MKLVTLSKYAAAALLCGIALPVGLNAQTQATVVTESLTLEQAYDRALETDQTIRIAHEEIRKANLRPWSALTRLGPSVTGRASYTRPEEEVSSGVGPVISNTKRADITVQQPLIDLTVFPAYRVGKLTAKSAQLAHQFTVRNVLFGVTTAYYDVLKGQRVVDISHQTLDLANQQLDLAQKRFDVGEVTKTDVLRARVQVEQARRGLIEAENSLRLARNVLTNILNLKVEHAVAVTEPPLYPESLESLDALEQRATDRREDLAVSKLAIDQAVQTHRQVLTQYGPTLVAQWTNQWLEPETFAQRNDFWTASVAVQVPFFTGGQRELDLKRTTCEKNQARLSHENLAKSVEVEVKNAWLDVQTLEQTLKAVRAEVEASEENYRNLQNQYRAGTATSLDVLTALRDLNTARTDLAVRSFDYQVALRNIERVTGVFQELRLQKARAR
jgi:outer membrane protein